MSLASGVTDATPIGGLYTFATGDFAFTGQTENLGITGRALGALDAALIVTPWVRPGTHALRTLTRSKAGRLAFIGTVGVGAAGYAPDAEAGQLSQIVKSADRLLSKKPPTRGSINLASPSAAKGRSYITYAFRNLDGEITYVGKAGGRGTPRQVLSRRISKGHSHYDSSLNLDVLSVHGSSSAARGAEHYYWRRLLQQGSPLTNVNKPIDFTRLDRATKGLKHLRRFYNE